MMPVNKRRSKEIAQPTPLDWFYRWQRAVVSRTIIILGQQHHHYIVHTIFLHASPGVSARFWHASMLLIFARHHRETAPMTQLLAAEWRQLNQRDSWIVRRSPSRQTATRASRTVLLSIISPSASQKFRRRNRKREDLSTRKSPASDQPNITADAARAIRGDRV